MDNGYYDIEYIVQEREDLFYALKHVYIFPLWHLLAFKLYVCKRVLEIVERVRLDVEELMGPEWKPIKESQARNLLDAGIVNADIHSTLRLSYLAETEQSIKFG